MSRSDGGVCNPATAFPGGRRCGVLGALRNKDARMGPTFMVVCFRHQQPTPRRNASQWLLGTFCHQKVQKNKRKVDATRLGKSRVVARRLTVDRRTFKENCKKGLAPTKRQRLGKILCQAFFLSVTEGRFSESRSFVFRASLWPRASWAA